MGKKADKKKRGPKGKRARAKAKLDRHWGEHVDEDALKESRGSPRGATRRTKKRTIDASKSTGTDVAPQHFEDFHRSQQDSSSESESENEGLSNEHALGQWLHDIEKRRAKTKDTGVAGQFIVDAVHRENEKEDDNGFSEMEEESENSLTDNDENVNGGDVSDADEDKRDVANDPFSRHFNKDLQPESETPKQPDLCHVPTRHLDSSLNFRMSGLTLEDLSASGFLLKPESNISVSSVLQKWSQMSDESFGWIRKVLQQNWKLYNRSARKENAEYGYGKLPERKLFSPLQTTIYPSLSSYSDILITAETRKNRDALQNLYILHILNHVLTSRTRVQKHNRKLKEQHQKGFGDIRTFRDQGYTRPKVLVLIPTRGLCLRFVKSLIQLLGDSAIVDNLDRFEDENGAQPVDENEDEINRKRRKSVLDAKGADWQEVFGDDVNDDDDFKIGISVTPKAVAKESSHGGVQLKLFAEFYHSDIIIASPLATKMAVAPDEDEEADIDFLSSIEICLVAHAGVLLMQNWDHVNEVLDLLNKQPKNNNETDFSRVRNYFLADQGAQWRQLIVSSNVCDPFILSTFKRHSKCLAGKLKLRRRVASDDAALCDVMVKVRQVFQRIKCNSFASQGDDRLKYFHDRVLPQVLQLKQKHTLIFIPSYFDFVSVRNLLLKKEVEFVSVTEYARVSEISRGRARFLQGRKPIMLYTGRCHFFSRHQIKGVKHLIFFGLPEHAQFYSEFLNALNDGLDEASSTDLESTTSCLALFTRYDANALEGVAGSQHCERMVKGEKSTFMFIS